jgi:hypothetical protein
LGMYKNAQFLGGFSMGFRTYNEIEPDLNIYLYYNRMSSFWNKMDSLSINGKKDYSIGYRDQIEKFKEIGFSPLRVLMPANTTVAKKDIILFEELDEN